MSNWLWIALGIGALALFAFGRGGCGMGHGGRGHGRHDDASGSDRPRETTPGMSSTLAAEHASHGVDPNRAQSRRHSHGC